MSWGTTTIRASFGDDDRRDLTNTVADCGGAGGYNAVTVDDGSGPVTYNVTIDMALEQMTAAIARDIDKQMLGTDWIPEPVTSGQSAAQARDIARARAELTKTQARDETTSTQIVDRGERAIDLDDEGE